MFKDKKVTGSYIGGLLVGLSQLFLEIPYIAYLLIASGFLVFFAFALSNCCLPKKLIEFIQSKFPAKTPIEAELAKSEAGEPPLPESETKKGALFSAFLGFIFVLTFIGFSLALSIIRIFLNR